MKILLVSESNSAFISQRLSNEATIAGHEITNVFYENICFDIGKEVVIYDRNTALGKFDAVITRMAAGKSFIYFKDLIIRNYISDSVVLNGESFLEWIYLGKMTQMYLFSKNGLPVPQSKIYGQNTLVDRTCEFPVILKRHLSRLGNGVSKVDSLEDLETSIKDETIPEILFQKYLPTRQDYRVFVIDGKALPKVMKKSAPDGAFITNAAQGGIVSSEDITDELRDLAQKATKIVKADYGGVDIMYDNLGNPYILEVNRSANFRAFEESTGINVARETILYLENKVKQKNG